MADQSHLGTFIWHEINTSDPGGAKSFYSDLTGWKTHEMDMGPAGKYTMLQNGGSGIGGITPADGQPAHWLMYIGVDDVDAAVKKAEALGGKAAVPAMDIPVGRFAVLTDPAGARFAVFTPKSG
ncbi:MAG: VOC family protein [SAR324 cluster bacterium]|nr:VOC family protein [SAR324 cluster bacterium]